MNLRLQKWVLGKKIYVHSTSSFAFKDKHRNLDYLIKKKYIALEDVIIGGLYVI